MNKMPCHISDGPQYGDELPEIDEDTYLSGSDEAFAKERADALNETLVDTARAMQGYTTSERQVYLAGYEACRKDAVDILKHMIKTQAE